MRTDTNMCMVVPADFCVTPAKTRAKTKDAEDTKDSDPKPSAEPAAAPRLRPFVRTDTAACLAVARVLQPRTPRRCHHPDTRSLLLRFAITITWNCTKKRQFILTTQRVLLEHYDVRLVTSHYIKTFVKYFSIIFSIYKLFFLSIEYFYKL